MMKNTFYFILIALSVSLSRYFSLDFLIMQKKNAMHILLNISQIKSNQTLKFGQFIEDKYFYSKIIEKMRQRD